MTSGSVSDIWPQAASTPVKAPDDASAPSAAACNKRRFAAASRDAPRPHPPAPRMAPTAEFPQILEYPPAPGLMTFCQFPSGTFGNVAAGTHAGSDRREAPAPADVRPPIRDITGEAVSKLKAPRALASELARASRLCGEYEAVSKLKAPRALASELARASRLCGEYYVISIESEDANMSIRKSILTTLAITLIATAPAWSQSLLKTLDPDNDGTVDLAEAKNAASKLFDK